MGVFFQYLSLLCILISYISSLRAFRLDMPLLFRQFSYFLLFVLLAEAFGVAWPKWIWQLTPFSQFNAGYYNVFHVVMYAFYLHFFYRVLQTILLKRIVAVLAITYILFAILNLNNQGWGVFNNYNYLFASFMMVFLSIAYYYQLLRARDMKPLRNDLVFWISTGSLIYHLGSAMSLFLINVMHYYSAAAAQKIHIIVMFAAMTMYLTYSIGYLCHRKQ